MSQTEQPWEWPDFSLYLHLHERIDKCAMDVRIGLAEMNGGCPECELCDGLTAIGRYRWAYCSRHQTKWLDIVGDDEIRTWPDVTLEHEELLYYQTGLHHYRNVTITDAGSSEWS